MYFLAKYLNGAYEVSELGFPTFEHAEKALEAMKIPFGFKWVLVHFPRFQHAAAA